MIDYFAVFVYTNGLAFPDTLSINASGPGSTDGTEAVKALVDDIWGARQAVMDAAGLTPDGVTEAPGTSQFLEALRLLGPGPGIGTEWDINDTPGVTGHRALFKNGQGILRANYPELDALVYVGDGNNAAVAAAGGAYYRADDAAGTIPNIVGIYLILPESRGYMPRGLDTAASVDPDGASRYLGDIQLDAFQGHALQIDDTGTGTFRYPHEVTEFESGANATAMISRSDGGVGDQQWATDGANGTPRTSSETRSVNR